ncbi:MAG: Na+/H+ antiporter NhaC family protein [Lachnospiraceae bacterium]|nr:Na+/H+ antiporter NhaC family protein [Lachnospiraceae bacterium]
MKSNKKILIALLSAITIFVVAYICFRQMPEVAADAANPSRMYATFWALVPPVVAIALALITKEVYSSLFIGIVAGALFYSNFNLETAYTTMLSEGFIASLSKSGNVGILIFLVVLGSIVVLMNKAGGSAAYGTWASKKIKSKKGALLSTFGLGCLIFVDDYFNCLTVGGVMKPLTDKHKVSRAKLAYLIDATAAPICMIAPISSWAAAVAGVVEGTDGLTLFIQAIPYNLYSLLTIFMIIFISAIDLDYGPMKLHEDNAKKGDLFTTVERPYSEDTEIPSSKGKVYDLVIPVIILIVCCILGMVYTGGFFDGVNFIDAFANCSASLGLSLGSVLALLIVIIYYICRNVLDFEECMKAIPEGFKAMVPAILILTFAWTLGGMTGLLGADVYVSGLFKSGAESLTLFLPAIVFLVAIFLSFATGTSWGTFTILLPIVVGVGLEGNLMLIAISACLAGAVCGDHCSPISDTTIMASTGAQCDHIAHVSTQLPYTITVAIVSFAGYIFAGFVQNAWIVLPVSMAVLAGVLLLIKAFTSKKTA